MAARLLVVALLGEGCESSLTTVVVSGDDGPAAPQPGPVSAESPAAGSAAGAKDQNDGTQDGGGFETPPGDVALSASDVNGVPTGSSAATAITLAITNTLIEVVKTKIGPKTTTDCRDENGYSAPQPVASGPMVDVSGVPEGEIVLCVRGGDGIGGWQPLGEVPVFGWTKVSTTEGLVPLGPTPPSPATLSGQPTGVSRSTSLAVTVAGSETTHYRHKIGEATAIICAAPAGYGAETPVTNAIGDDLSLLADGPLRLCVVGRDDAGAWQEPSAATVALWTKDTAAPIPVLAGVPTGTNAVTTLAVDVTNGDGLVAYRYKVGPAAATDCGNAVGYGSDLPGTLDIVDDVSGLVDGLLRLCVTGTDGAGNVGTPLEATVASWTKTIPAVTSVGMPTEPRVSVAGAITTTQLDVTCNVDGTVAILDAADGDVLVAWTAVLADGPTTLPVSGAGLQAVASGDGAVALRVICRNPDAVESAPDNSRSLVLDTTPPPALGLFSGTTGSGSEGHVDLTLDFPPDLSDVDLVSIRRLQNGLPAADCESDGDEVTALSAPFGDQVIVDPTGSGTGEVFGYRMCILDAVGHLTATDVAAGVRAKDTAPPPALPAFSGATGSLLDGDIGLTWSFPASLDDYAVVIIRTLAGTAAPAADCTTNGAVILSIPPPFVPTTFLHATGTAAGDEHSYRACVYDTTGNLTASNTVVGIPSLDTSIPVALQSFTGAPGGVHAAIDLTLGYPADTSDYSRLTIRRLAGGTPPHVDCTSNGTEIHTTTGPFVSGVVTDATGSATGAPFSYRVCIEDTSLNVSSSNTVINVNATDLVAPPILTAVSGVTGANQGAINVTLDFPASLSDYSQVVLRRLAGATAPACTTGTAANTFNTGQFTDQTWTDTGLTPGSSYSYRVCIYDASGNLTNSQTVLNVTAKFNCNGQVVGGFCWYLSTVGQSCTTACSTHGGYHTATKSYAGSDGTNANCSGVLTALGQGGGATANACSGIAKGCLRTGSPLGAPFNARCTTATTAGATDPWGRRACACNQ